MNLRTALRTISVVTVLVGAVGIFGPAVEAKHRDDDRRHVRVVIRPNVVVPHAISFRHPGPFGQFYAGRVYYRPHHHYHATYNLPVVVNHRVVYRPYNYCRGQLYLRTGATLPHLAFNVVFGDNYDDDRYYTYERDRQHDNDRYYDDDRDYRDGPGH